MSKLSPEQVEAVRHAVCGLPGSARKTKPLETESFESRWEAFTGPELALLRAALQHTATNDAEPMAHGIEAEIARRQMVTQ